MCGHNEVRAGQLLVGGVGNEELRFGAVLLLNGRASPHVTLCGVFLWLNSNRGRNELFSQIVFIVRTGKKELTQMFNASLACHGGLAGADVNGNMTHIC